jgi:1-pyrroline-5-carboxylate dehydrogenase
MVGRFRNEPLVDFTKPANRKAFEKALAQVRGELGRELPLVIGGERIQTAARIESRNPAHPAEIVARAAKAAREHADQAVRAAAGAFASWGRTPPRKRASVLFKAAAIMRRRKHVVSATMVIEAGKTWVEADADTAEAIDFLEFYGREMLRYAEPPKLTPVPGERNRLEYLPLGVGAIIAPWNFPCAIFCGMSSAALVAGNTVVMKPASNTVLTGWRVFECLEEAGAPPGTINFLTGSGGEVGDALVDHPLVRFLSFTGSKEVGIRIYERAARVQPGQTWLKRVVAEMGGKDAIIVDRDVDLDEAVQGVVASAFGYQGQKCSACSRAIVDASVYDAFVEKLVAATESLRVGDPADPSTHVGPVIDQNQFKKILEYIQVGKGEGRLVAGGGAADAAGYFVKPTVIVDVPPMARIAREEIFGPVLAVIKARDFTEALEIANRTEYGLTGAVYSKNRKRLRRAADEFHVGNLYFNRKCTGALVGAHPFGGFNMSGTDSKAGGSDYLLLFLQAKVLSEKVARR